MRGPLFSGAVGHRSTLERLAALVRPRAPVVVLSTVWLAEALAEVTPVLLLVEPRRLRAAMRARKRCDKAGRQLTVALAAEALPLRPAGAGALVLDDLAELEDDDLLEYVPDLVPFINEGGLLLTLDRTKEPSTESRIAGSFLAGGLVRIGQERPREGALITVGAAPPKDVVAVLSAAALATSAHG